MTQHIRPFELYKIDKLSVLFDCLFYGASLVLYFKNWFLLLLVVPILFLKYQFTNEYIYTNDYLYSEYFLELLNIINSYLSIGATLDNAMLQSIKQVKFPAYIDLRPIDNSIHINEPMKKRLSRLEVIFPIPDARTYVSMIESSTDLGSNLVDVTNNALDKMSKRIRVMGEMRQMLYEKRLEQKILSFSPVVVILMIMSTSKDYLDVLYEEPLGLFLIGFSFALVVGMKEFSNYLVRIKE